VVAGPGEGCDGRFKIRTKTRYDTEEAAKAALNACRRGRYQYVFVDQEWCHLVHWDPTYVARENLSPGALREYYERTPPSPPPRRPCVISQPPLEATKAPALQATAPAFTGLVPRRFARAAPLIKTTPPPPPPKDGDRATLATPVALTLPVHAYMPAILSAIGRRRLTCIRGETGCGKSSEIPLAIVRDAMAQGGKAAREVNVIVTQPRRLAARALASRVASLLGEPVGHTCGYRVGDGEGESGPKTRLLFVTSGWLLTRWGLTPPSCTWRQSL
jgi:hypothetical protein